MESTRINYRTFRSRKRRHSRSDFLASRIRTAEAFYFQLESYAAITSLKFIPVHGEESLLLCGDAEGNIGALKMQSLQSLATNPASNLRLNHQIRTLKSPTSSAITSIAYMACSDKIVVSGEDGSMKLLSCSEGGMSLANSWLGHGCCNKVNSVEVQQRTGMVISAGDEGRVLLWDTRLPCPVGTLRDKRPAKDSKACTSAQSARVCPSCEELLFTSWSDGDVDVWDLRVEKSLGSSLGTVTGINCTSNWDPGPSRSSTLQFSKDGLFLLHTRDHRNEHVDGLFSATMSLYDVYSRKVVWDSKECIPTTNSLSTNVILCSHDGLLVYGGDLEGDCFSVDIESQKKSFRKMKISSIYGCKEKIPEDPSKNVLSVKDSRNNGSKSFEKYPGVTIMHRHTSSYQSTCITENPEMLYYASADISGELIVKSSRYPGT